MAVSKAFSNSAKELCSGKQIMLKLLKKKENSIKPKRELAHDITCQTVQNSHDSAQLIFSDPWENIST